MQITKKANERGFTILELLISMAAFSSMVLIAGLTTLQIGRMYYKGATSISTQETTRSAIAAITEQVQFTADAITSSTGSVRFGSIGPPDERTAAGAVRSVCIGSTRYTYIINRRLSSTVETGHNNALQQIRHVLWQDTKNIPECTPADLTKDNPSEGSGSNGVELLEDNMRLSLFAITPSTTRPDLVSINIGIIYGDNDLIQRVNPFNPNSLPVGCRPGQVSSQWCASTNLTTQAFRRYPRPL